MVLGNGNNMGLADEIESVFEAEVELDQNWTKNVVNGIRTNNKEQVRRGIEEYGIWMQSSVNTQTVSWHLVRLMRVLKEKSL